MKKKNFKIAKSKLFVFQNNQHSNPPTAETDPTTSMITLTVTGIFAGK